MILSPEMASKIAIWKAKALNNTLTKEEQREIVAHLRQDRKGAHVMSETAKKAKAKKDIPDGDDLLKQLMGDL